MQIKNMIHCPNCGAEINNNQDCPYCGYQNPNKPQPQTQVQPTATMPTQTIGQNTNTKKSSKAGLIIVIVIILAIIGFIYLKGTNNNISIPTTNNGGKEIKVSGIKEAYESGSSEKDDGNFFMPVEDVFSIKGRGTVITGRVKSGSVKKGDTIEILSSQNGVKKVTVAAIEAFRKELDEATAGDNFGILKDSI